MDPMVSLDVKGGKHNNLEIFNYGDILITETY